MPLRYIYIKKKRNIEGAESKGTADRESKTGEGRGRKGGEGRGNGGRQDEILRLHYTRMASSSSRIYKSDCISRLRNTHIYNIQIIAIIYAVHRAYRGSITHVSSKIRVERRVFAGEAGYRLVSYKIHRNGVVIKNKIDCAIDSGGVCMCRLMRNGIASRPSGRAYRELLFPYGRAGFHLHSAPRLDSLSEGHPLLAGQLA